MAGAVVCARPSAAGTTTSDVDKLAYQFVKYRQREGWTHADVLRSAADRGRTDQLQPYDDAHAALYNWVTAEGWTGIGENARTQERVGRGPRCLGWSVRSRNCRRPTTAHRVVSLIAEDIGVSWEMIPDRCINEPVVWEALIDNGMPQTALLRQLPRITG